MKKAYAVFLRNIYVLRSSPTRVVPYILWAALDIVLWGFITKYLDAVGNSGFSFVPTLLGAVLLWDFLTRVQQGVTTPFLEDVWQKNFLNMFASPITIGQYLWGFVISSTLTSLIGLVIMVALAGILFHLSLLQLGLFILPFGAILFICGIALGIFGAGIILRFGPSAEWLIWPIPAVLAPFVGVFYPLAVLPHWMQTIALAVPPAYVFQGMRGILEGAGASISTMILGIGLSLMYLLLSYLFFMYVYRVVLKNGLIARFSAENV
jgi:ABC-2 type transport system permease protein